MSNEQKNEVISKDLMTIPNAISFFRIILITPFVANTPLLVGLGYPVGWTLCFIVEVTYFLLKYIRGSKRNAAAA